MLVAFRVVRWKAFRVSYSTAAQDATSYPFSNAAVALKASDPSPSLALRRGRGLMEHVRQELVPPEKQDWLKTLFARNHPDRLLPGSVINITQTHAPTTFTGVLISLRRKGLDSSMILRNVVQRVGVEIQVFLGSPHLKEITVLQAADGKRAKRAKRAKLYYLRDQPDKMSTISAGFRK